MSRRKRGKGRDGVSFWRTLLAIIWKDLRLEWRTGDVLLTPGLLALLLMLVFVFALPPGTLRVEGVFTASMWTTLFFAGTIGVSRGFGRERSDGRLAGLLLAPVDRSAVFLAKAVVSFVFMALVTVVMMPLFFGAFGQSLAAPLWQWIVVVGLVIMAYSGVGTLVAAVAAQLRSGEILYPVLLFPLLVPVVLAAVHLSDALLFDGGWVLHGGWLQMLLLYNVLSWGVPYLLFEYVVEV